MLRYGDFSIFQDGRHRHLGFSNFEKTRMWPMPNLMVALPNMGGALCSAPQSLADAHY